MASMFDGVSKLWLIRPSSWLDIDGYPDDRAAIQALLLYKIDWANPRKRLDEIDAIAEEAKAALLESIAEEERLEQEPTEPDEFGD